MIPHYLFFLFPLSVSFFLSLFLIKRMRLVSTKDMAWMPRRYDKIKFGVPQIGGISLFPLLIISFCATLIFPYIIDRYGISLEMKASSARIFQLSLGAAVIYLIGLKDDLNGTSSKYKFLGLLLAASLFPITNLWIKDFHGLFGIDSVPAWIGMPLTVVAVMYLIEVFQLADGIDGLSSGLLSLTFLLFLCYAIWRGYDIVVLVSAVSLGLVVPFWVMKMVDRTWRRTFIGHAGTYVLGYMVSYLMLGINYRAKTQLEDGMFVITFSIIMLPALDTIRVLLSRARESRSLVRADKNQIHHKLIRTGMTRFRVIETILFLTIFFVGMTTVLVYFGVNITLIFVLDLLLWYIMNKVINRYITKAENNIYHKVWRKTYGRKAWEDNVPEETIRRKQKTFGSMGLPSHVIGDSELVFIPDGMNSFERNAKRLFDLLVSGICLIAFSPLFLLSYILIKLDDGGPAIYKQERIGRFGRPFYIYKFRSMRMDAEKAGPALSHAGGDEDPRLTKIGKFLRAHHLDELPQLWNVFNGDMAFIGYRPERKFFIDQIMEHDPRYAFLYQIRPGVTSYATLYNGYTDTMEKMLRRLEFDLYYLAHRSWWFDCKILFLTFMSIVGGKKF